MSRRSLLVDSVRARATRAFDQLQHGGRGSSMSPSTPRGRSTMPFVRLGRMNCPLTRSPRRISNTKNGFPSDLRSHLPAHLLREVLRAASHSLEELATRSLRSESIESVTCRVCRQVGPGGRAEERLRQPLSSRLRPRRTAVPTARPVASAVKQGAAVFRREVEVVYDQHHRIARALRSEVARGVHDRSLVQRVLRERPDASPVAACLAAQSASRDRRGSTRRVWLKLMAAERDRSLDRTGSRYAVESTAPLAVADSAFGGVATEEEVQAHPRRAPGGDVRPARPRGALLPIPASPSSKIDLAPCSGLGSLIRGRAARSCSSSCVASVEPGLTRNTNADGSQTSP